MLTTATVNGNKVSIKDYVKSESLALCPLGHTLVAKKGTKVTHHFAHAANHKCDPWRQGLTRFHFQWQDIVADHNNLEVCMDEGGNIVGHSSFRNGSQFNDNNAASGGHIADIIKPYPGNQHRPLIIEIQHSSMSKEVIMEREAYYKHMVWVFDITPRVVSRAGGKYNKIVYVDGAASYLKEKVTYLGCFAATNELNPVLRPGQMLPSSLGDQAFGTELEAISGFFIVINMKTKYWTDTTAPTYYDSGFGILRLIMRLKANSVLAMFMSYEHFVYERMPPINVAKINETSWFHTLMPSDLVKLKIIPRIVDVGKVFVAQGKIVIKHNGDELADLGFERGMDDWHAGEFTPTDLTTRLGANVLGSNIIDNRPAPPPGAHNEPLLVAKIRRFLCLGMATRIVVVNKRNAEHIVVYCDSKTYGLKDKFAAMGMTYRGKPKEKGISQRKAAKATGAMIDSCLTGKPLPRAYNAMAIKTAASGMSEQDLFENTQDAYYIGKLVDLSKKLATFN